MRNARGSDVAAWPSDQDGLSVPLLIKVEHAAQCCLTRNDWLVYGSFLFVDRSGLPLSSMPHIAPAQTAKHIV